eukprot:CAMPEP_0204895030 /NCGR_PEP_ID=MMETSP1349-20130617/33786_1 /ASSEMBLY_ACC=CAM_ASM_000710 /TAXON_ID=215587 /ORGANISM="Aplanochytrium stocchinoi, Strain GSBS06" /LENGTH=130 /DNA_ID=CAMNT_0052062333 /DNA_START=552 /DNA_END=944 /DNA_ORIENTATION=-
MGNRSENLNTILRYLSFALAWIFKLRDQWDSALWEVFLVVMYALAAIYGMFILNPRLMKLWDVDSIKKGGLCFCAAIILFGLKLNPRASPIFAGFMHLFAGGASFFFWKAVPVMDKKNDSLLPTAASAFR